MEINTDRTNEKSDELMAEFWVYLKDVKDHNPDIEKRVVFESWVIQKIAGIHKALELMTLNNLR